MYLSLPDTVYLENMNGFQPDAVCLANMNGLEDFLDTVLSYFFQCCDKMSHRKKGLFWPHGFRVISVYYSRETIVERPTGGRSVRL